MQWGKRKTRKHCSGGSIGDTNVAIDGRMFGGSNTGTRPHHIFARLLCRFFRSVCRGKRDEVERFKGKSDEIRRDTGGRSAIKAQRAIRYLGSDRGDGSGMG